MAKHVSDPILCPRCRGDLSSTEHQGQATCPHCKAPVLFAGADGDDTDCLALPVQFAEFITDGVIARRGGEVILHGWHKSGDPEVVIKLWPQSESKPPKPIRHPNVVRFLKAGTEAGFDFQVHEWAEGSALDSAADLLTPRDHLSPTNTVSLNAIPPAETVTTELEQSEPLPVLTEADTQDLPPFGAPWQSQFNRRLHNGLLRGLGSNGLGCSMPMAGFLADGICVSLYAICATLIAVQFVTASVVDAVWATPWLAWQWFWLRHYRSLLSWKVRTAEVTAALLILALSLADDTGFWRGVFVLVIFDTCLAAFVAGRTLHLRFGQRRNPPTPSALQEPEQPKPADLSFPEKLLRGLGLAIGSILIGYVTNVISDGKMKYEHRRFVRVKTDQERQADLAMKQASEQVKTLTEAISKTTNPHEQARLYLQRAQAYRQLGQTDRAHTDEGRAQQLRLWNPPSLNPR